MKIYTKKGDDGGTSLFGGDRISKHDQRVEAYGTIDEVNSFLGLLISHVPTHDSYRPLLSKIQHLLFNVGSLLATADESFLSSIEGVDVSDIESLELAIDQMDHTLAPLKNFILPGGSIAVSTAHICRTVCRRAERRIVLLGLQHESYVSIIPFINRLSDFFFVYARHLSLAEGNEEVIWQPKQGK